MSESCPKCWQPVDAHSRTESYVRYNCGTTHGCNGFAQSRQCRINELEAAIKKHHDQHAELEAEVAAMKTAWFETHAEVERLRADKERLDWLEKKGDEERWWRTLPVDDPTPIYRPLFRQNEPITREAIDRARKS